MVGGGGGCRHLVSTEVKAEEVITSWKNSVLCVCVGGATAVNLSTGHLWSASSLTSPKRVGHPGIRGFALCSSTISSFFLTSWDAEDDAWIRV